MNRITLFVLALFVVGLVTAAVLALRGLQADAELDRVPTGVPVPDPTELVVSMELSEDLTQEVSLDLLALERAILHGGDDAEEHFSSSFRGTDPRALTPEHAESLPMDAELIRYRADDAAVVDAVGFVNGVKALLQGWKTLDDVELAIERADFQVGRPTWGKLRFSIEWVGATDTGAPRVLTIRGDAQVVQQRARWRLHALDIETADTLSRPRPIFSEVSSDAGVHFEGREFQRGSENWNGAASADVDGDGLWDLFIPNPEGNFLYVARREGGYEDQASRRGVRAPAGGTGVVFFDFDNDGDQDLLIGDEAYRDADGTLHGNPLRLFRNDRASDSWSFVDVTEAVGISNERYTYGITVLDFDLDGYLDFYLSNYGRFTGDRPNSWTDATNGHPNQLYRNVNGCRFEEVSASAGVEDSHWTFLAAAADYDRDGDIDLYQVNDFGENVLLKNSGDGTFADVTGGEILGDLGFGMSASWADFNNDGTLDLYVSNMFMPVAHRILARFSSTGADIDRMWKMAAGNTLLLGRGGDSFERSPPESGAVDCLWAWASVPVDVDLDGVLDLFCTNGFISHPEPGDALTYYWRNVIASSIDAEKEPSVLVRREVTDRQYLQQMTNFVWKQGRSNSGHQRDHLWINLGDARFWDASGVSGANAPVDGRAVIVADFDNDGDPDLFVHGMQGNRHYLYRNDAQDPDDRFLNVRLRATRGQYEAVGAEVIVHGPHGPHSQVLSRGAQFLSSQPPELVFGMGEAASARVEVLWPGGSREDFGNVPCGSSVVLVEGTGIPEFRSRLSRPLVR